MAEGGDALRALRGGVGGVGEEVSSSGRPLGRPREADHDQRRRHRARGFVRAPAPSHDCCDRSRLVELWRRDTISAGQPAVGGAQYGARSRSKPTCRWGSRRRRWSCGRGGRGDDGKSIQIRKWIRRRLVCHLVASHRHHQRRRGGGEGGHRGRCEGVGGVGGVGRVGGGLVECLPHLCPIRRCPPHD